MCHILSFSVLLVSLLTVECANTHNHGGLDIFDELRAQLQVSDDKLSEENIGNLVDRLFMNFTCTSTAVSSCSKTICLSSIDIINVVGASADGIKESEFENMAMVLLFYMTHVTQFCKQNVNLTHHALDYYQTNFTTSLLSMSANNVTTETMIEEYLETLNVSYVPGVHQEDDHGHEEEVLIFAEECLAADLIINKFGKGKETVEREHFGEIAGLILYNILTASHIKHTCRLLPTKDFFLDELFEQFHSVNKTLSIQAFSEILTTLSIVSDTSTESEHDHAHTERRKRSVDQYRERRITKDILSRVRREEEAHDHSMPKTCYTADQLLVIHATPAPISKEDFTQLCPALIYQQVSESCKTLETSTSKTLTSTAQRYGYSILAVFIICLCSVLGAALFPCTKETCYDTFMGLFMGLAVGTLVTDALLHLLPEAFGIHIHGDDDGHGHASSDIVIEDFVWFSIVSIAGIYAFFLLESIMGLFGGSHSHSHSLEHDKDNECVSNSRDNECVSNSRDNDYVANSKEIDFVSSSSTEKIQNSFADKPVTEHTKKFNHLAFMIVFGDAIHNFADGLAIGAAFTQSVTEGVGVSIAVFCHELPHELGDFAVLLRSGMRFRNALLWNIASSLTSFIGLFIGLSVAEDTTARQWIFAISAGMFLYIALVNILPDLTRPSSVKMFLIVNVGILTGAAILILLSIFEGKISV